MSDCFLGPSSLLTAELQGRGNPSSPFCQFISDPFQKAYFSNHVYACFQNNEIKTDSK